MKDYKYKIISNREINEDIFEMILTGDSSEIKNPGQFVNLRIEGFYLRRPISISLWNEESITLVYKVVGEGTKTMSKMKKGLELYALCPLGNGFDIEARELKDNQHNIYIIGGGLGAAPLYTLTIKLREKGYAPKVILGVKNEKDLIYLDKYKSENIDFTVATEDGSMGIKGLVTDAFDKADYVFACGPEPMLKAVYSRCQNGQFDFEGRMACGFGACMGCSCEVKYGSKRICKDGPVLRGEEILW